MIKLCHWVFVPRAWAFIGLRRTWHVVNMHKYPKRAKYQFAFRRLQETNTQLRKLGRTLLVPLTVRDDVPDPSVALMPTDRQPSGLTPRLGIHPGMVNCVGGLKEIRMCG